MAETHPSFDVLQAYLVARAAFPADDLAFVRTLFLPRSQAAGEFLQRAPRVTNAAWRGGSPELLKHRRRQHPQALIWIKKGSDPMTIIVIGSDPLG